MQLFLFCLFSEVYEKKWSEDEWARWTFCLSALACQGIKQPFTPERGASGAGARQNQILCSHVHSSKVCFQMAASLANIFPSLKSRCIKTKPKPKSASHTGPAPSGGLRDAEAHRLVIVFTALRKPRRKNDQQTILFSLLCADEMTSYRWRS